MKHCYPMGCALIIYLILLTNPTAVNAQQPPPSAPGWQFEFGAGALAYASPYKDADISATALPYFGASYGRWSFFKGGTLLDYQWLSPRDEWRLGTGISYRDETFDNWMDSDDNGASDDPVFAGYSSPSGEVIAVLNAGFRAFNLSVAQDVSGQSGSFDTAIGYQPTLYQNDKGVQIKAGVGVRYLGEDYVNHLYGIEDKNIAPMLGRPAYSVNGGAVNYQLSASVVYPLNRKWALVGNVQAEYLDDTISASPLVGQDYTGSFMLLAVYRK